MPSTGRGGAGNIRASSTKCGGGTDPEDSLDTRLKYTIPAHDASLDPSSCDDEHLSSLSRSQFRGRARRGRTKNIYVGPAEADIPEEEEPECATHQQPPGVDLYLMHSTGSGGYANLSFGELPYTVGTLHPHGADHLHEARTHEYETTGLSNAGNISPDHSPESKKLRNKLIAAGHGLVRKIQSPSVAERPRSRNRRVSTGRGGMGNIRAVPAAERIGSRDLPDIRRRYTIPMSDLNGIVPTGRGRSRTVRSPPLDTSRRGNDYGNVKPIPVRPKQRVRGYDRDVMTTTDSVHDTGVYSIYASDRVVYQHPRGVHSAGRGGVAHPTPGKSSYIEGTARPRGAGQPLATHAHEHDNTGAGHTPHHGSRGRKEPRDKGHGLMGFLPRLSLPSWNAHKGGHSDGKERFPTAGIGTLH